MTHNTRIEAISRRRSIRKYNINIPISRTILQQLIAAGMFAPTARNLQPWHFIIITDRKILDQIPAIHPYAQMMFEATAAILVCGDRLKDPNDFYLVQNGSAATQNILLEAWAHNIGSVWLGVYGREERMESVGALFNLPEHVIPISLIALGYPAEEKPVPERFQPLLIHENQFGNGWQISL